jgi:sarcosine oxidase subunit gamma
MADQDILPDAGAFALTVRECDVQMSVLRVLRSDQGAVTALSEAFGFAWPGRPNTAASEPIRVAWLAPGEWAIFEARGRIQSAVETACRDRVHHLADVSAGRRLWTIDGDGSRALLSKGCGLDTHPNVMSPGHCAQTLFAQASALLVVRAPGRGFDLIADASVAGHLRAWFLEAAKDLEQ